MGGNHHVHAAQKLSQAFKSSAKIAVLMCCCRIPGEHHYREKECIYGGLQRRGRAPREAIAQLRLGNGRNADLRHRHFGEMVIESKTLFRDGVAGGTGVQQIASVHRPNNSRLCGGSSLRSLRKSSNARGSALKASSLKLKNSSQEAR